MVRMVAISGALPAMESDHLPSKGLRGHMKSCRLWQRYRCLRRIFWVVLAGFPLWIAISARILDSIFAMQRLLGWGPFVIAGPWLILLVALHAYSKYWPCPRCRRPFFTEGYYQFWSETCLHCSLPKWSCDDPDCSTGSGKASSRTEEEAETVRKGAGQGAGKSRKGEQERCQERMA